MYTGLEGQDVPMPPAPRFRFVLLMSVSTLKALKSSLKRPFLSWKNIPSQPVLLKNGQILRIENPRNQDNAHRAVKNRDRKLKVKGIDLPREVDSAVKNDAQSAQEETNLHKKAPL